MLPCLKGAEWNGMMCGCGCCCLPGESDADGERYGYLPEEPGGKLAVDIGDCDVSVSVFSILGRMGRT